MLIEVKEKCGLSVSPHYSVAVMMCSTLTDLLVTKASVSESARQCRQTGAL